MITATKVKEDLNFENLITALKLKKAITKNDYRGLKWSKQSDYSKRH